MGRSSNTEQERVREVQERKRSGAAGLHKDKRTKRRRTRIDDRAKAIKDSIGKG